MTIENFGCHYSMVVSIQLTMFSLPASSHIQFDRQHSTFNSILTINFTLDVSSHLKMDRLLTTEFIWLSAFNSAF